MYQSIHLVIENFVNKEYNISSEVERFISLLKMKSIAEMKDKFRNSKTYLKAIEKVERYMEDEEFIGLYDVEEKRKWEMNEMKLAGLEEGRLDGEKEKTIELAKKMLEEKISKEKIMKITGLSIEEIEEIEKNNS